MTRDEIIRAFDRMRVWQRGDQRAVHKPLLVLYALARVGASGTATIDRNDAEPQLICGPTRSADPHPPELSCAGTCCPRSG